jgi:hypothetical protein
MFLLLLSTYFKIYGLYKRNMGMGTEMASCMTQVKEFLWVKG